MSQIEQIEQEIKRVQKILNSEKRFWKTLETTENVIYNWAKDYIAVQKKDGKHYEYILAHEFVDRIAGEHIPDTERTPLLILRAVSLFNATVNVMDWKKYITSEYLEELLLAAIPSDFEGDVEFIYYSE